MAWIGVFGSFEASNWLSDIWGTPLAAVLLTLAVGAMALRARHRQDWTPVKISILGAAVLLIGKCRFDSLLLVYAGLVLMIVACAWSSRANRFQNVALDRGHHLSQ
ncbi:MAG TPA: hypothetical protein VHR66_17885 [Gemmataceae bacterium]|jgi:uncharacterized membrane protein|nr:hypothetical protein [Gemmataceae bacterium]